MVAERSWQSPGPEDVGYSSDGSLPRSERPSADAFSAKIPGEMDGSCDASGECTTDDSDDRPLTRRSTETVSIKRDRKLSSRRRGRPRSMTELYKRKSPDVSLFASNAELSAWPCPGSLTKLNSPRLRSHWRRSRLARSSVGSTPSGGSEGGIRYRKSSSSASSDPEESDRSPSFRVGGSDSNPGAPPTTEETSSVSDQVWDGYQDPLYLSESYSESTVDQEEFRKVTEFGDDYGVLIERSPKEARIPTPEGEDEEQTSDEEDFRYVIDQANRAWHVTGQILSETATLSPCQKAELVATCRAHLRCLGLIDEHLRGGREDTRFHHRVRGVIRKWETMEERVERVEEEGEEERSVRERLEELDGSVLERETDDDESPAASFDRLEEKIESLQVSLRALQESRERLLEVNLKVRRLDHPSLSEKVAESYRLWERVYRRNRDLSAELRLTRNLWSRFLDLSAKLRNASSHFSDQESTEGRKEMRSLLEELERRLAGSPALPGIREAAEWVESKARRQSEEEEEVEAEEEEEEEEEKATEAGPSDASEIRPEEEEGRKKEPSLLRRILRVAIPVQLALVLLYCLARLLEPRCCDSVNNLHFSPAPQLRYVRGPPPL